MGILIKTESEQCYYLLMHVSILICGVVATLSTTLFASSLGQTLRAFEDKPGYVQPVATSFGTILNQGWIQSARVGKETGWNFSLIAPLAYIGTADHTYDFSYDDNCAELKAMGKFCQTNGTSVLQDVPTIWGPNSNAVYYEYRSSGDAPEDVMPVQIGTADDGHETIRKIPMLGLPYFQLGISKHFIQGTLRGFWLPSISEFGGYYSVGLGLQYDLTRFVPPSITEKGFFTSITCNASMWALSYVPSEDFTGELTLDGSASQAQWAIGWKYGAMEIFTEFGYEISSLKAGGALVELAPAAGDDPNIRPSIQVDGRNGARASINVAFHIGSWNPVLGQSFGAQIGSNLNILQFGKEGQ